MTSERDGADSAMEEAARLQIELDALHAKAHRIQLRCEAFREERDRLAGSLREIGAALPMGDIAAIERILRRPAIEALSAALTRAAGPVEDAPENLPDAQHNNLPRGYYMMTRGSVGNCAIWWAKGKCGYTTNLDEAHVFTEEEILAGVTDRDTDIAYPVVAVDAAARKHVHLGSLGPGLVQSERRSLRNAEAR